MTEQTRQSIREQFKVSEVELIYRSKVKAKDRPKVSDSKSAYQVLMQSWDENKIELQEQFKILLLNNSDRCLGVMEVSTGGITSCIVDLRLIFAAALKAKANRIIMAHSVEDQKVIGRIDHLRKVDAHVRFLSLEPLLGPLPDLNLEGIHWVIVGGESGMKSRPMNKEWVDDIRLQCEVANVPFFFKQWGGKNKKSAGRLLDGKTYDEMPESFLRQSVVSENL